MAVRHVRIGKFEIGNDLPLCLIAGPCQMESRDHAIECAAALAETGERAKINLVFKCSFDKANRTSPGAARGVGLDRALSTFAEIKDRFGLPILTDVHTEQQCVPVAQVVDILQIPALLCRQTDLIVAAAKTGAVINIKKGQFLAPWDIVHPIDKVRSAGNDKVLLTERGTTFGYNSLVTDMRGLAIMAQTGCPVVCDVTHAVQFPGGMGASSGGDRRMAPVLARAAVAVGVAGIFAETHPDPDRAPSDGACMLPLRVMGEFIGMLQAIDDVVKKSAAPLRAALEAELA